ncbi:MAG: hypothetical protein KF812_12265 [Fimbriimonadaceae bacterium]|nr:hypothetical protein [Fimbriimonadaceae bacterium]
MPVDSWVQTSVGIYSILGSIAFFVFCAVCFFMIRVLLSLQAEVKSIGHRVNSITGRVDRMAKDIQYITEEASVRSTGLMRVMDDSVGANLQRIERFGPWVIVGIAAWKYLSGKRSALSAKSEIKDR